MGRAARERRLRLRFVEEGGFAKLDQFVGSAAELRADPLTIKFPSSLPLDVESLKGSAADGDVSQS